jgi:hypothetical protein
MEEGRGKREERKGRKEKGKSESKHTYPPTHHMCVVICKRMKKVMLYKLSNNYFKNERV